MTASRVAINSCAHAADGARRFSQPPRSHSTASGSRTQLSCSSVSGAFFSAFARHARRYRRTHISGKQSRIKRLRACSRWARRRNLRLGPYASAWLTRYELGGPLQSSACSNFLLRSTFLIHVLGAFICPMSCWEPCVTVVSEVDRFTSHGRQVTQVGALWLPRTRSLNGYLACSLSFLIVCCLVSVSATARSSLSSRRYVNNTRTLAKADPFPRDQFVIGVSL